MNYIIELEEVTIDYSLASAIILVTDKYLDSGANIFVYFDLSFEDKIGDIHRLEIDYLENDNDWVKIMNFITSDESINKIIELIQNYLDK